MGYSHFAAAWRSICLVALTVALDSGRAYGQAWAGSCGGTDWYEGCFIADACGPSHFGCLNNWFTSPGCGMACPLPFPGPGDIVTISTGNGVTLAGNATIAGLNCQKPFTLNSGTLTVNGTATFADTVNWNGGGMAGAGQTTTTGTLLIGSVNTKTLQRTLRNEGTATWSSTGTFDLSNGAVFDNQNSFAVTSDANVTFSFGSPARFDNNGTFIKQDSIGTTSIGGGVEFNNYGNVSVNSGVLQIATSGTSTGGFQVAGIGVLEFKNPNTYTFLLGTSITGGGVLVVDGANLTLAGDVNADCLLALDAGAISGPGDLTCSYGNWNGGSMVGPGMTTFVECLSFGGPAVKSVNGRTMNIPCGTWHEDSTISLSNGATINASGHFDVHGNGLLNHSSGATSTFNNSGVFSKLFSTGVTTIQGVVFNNTGTVSLGTGTLKLQTTGTSSGTFNLMAADTELDMSSGSYTFGDGARVDGLGLLRLSGATLTIAGNPNYAYRMTQSAGTLTGAGTITLFEGLTWTGGSMAGTGVTQALTYPGTSRDGSISGAGLKTLNGRTFINANDLDWSGSGSISMANGARFENGREFRAKNDATLVHSSGAPSLFDNRGSFTKLDSFGVTFIDNVVFNNSGTVAVNTGTLRLATTGTTTGTTSIADGARLEMSAGSHTLDGADVTGDGSLRLSGATVTVANEVSATNLTLVAGVLTGAGTITCQDSLAWTSGLMSGVGETVIAEDATATLSGGFLKSAQVRRITNEGEWIWIDGGTLDLSNGAAFFNFGTFELFSDAVVTFSFGSPAAFNNLGTFTKLNSGGELQFGIPFNNSGQVQIQTGTFRTSSPYTQTGGATMVSGGATFRSSPSINLQGGTLSGSGTVIGNAQNTGAEVSPGSPVGTLTITGNYTQSAGGTLFVEIGGPTPGTEHDRLAISGTATLGGALVVELINGFVPGTSQSFTILTAGSVTGTFATVILPPGYLEVSKSPTAVTLTSCDLDSDADMDLDDYAEFVSCMDGPDIASQSGCDCADAEHDDDVDLADFAVLQRVF